MFTGQIDVISNRATWQSDDVEIVDEDNVSIDLTNGALNLDIQVTIKDLTGCWVIATANIANGKVTIPGPGFQWQFEDSDLHALCAGTYRLGVKVTMNDFITDLIDGTIAVIEGN